MRKSILALLVWLCALALLNALAHIWPEAKEIEHFVGLAGTLIFWFGDFFFLRFPKGWDKADRSKFPDGATKPSPPEPPLGYHGPFWNKPSPEFLQKNAHPFTESQGRVALCLLLVPFGILAYLFLH
jgi:hypothetical protein